ncbi:MAG: hypothetical protein IJU77_12290 [Butyrivibrio sp.]|nr:hypothetical protein [Butyrivibrio sp.]
MNHIEKENDLVDYKATKATIELAKEIKEHYETKAKLIKSPYYVLTREDDVQRFMDPNGNVLGDQIRDAGYVTYLQDMQRLRNDPLSKGVKPDISKKKGKVPEFEFKEELIDNISLQDDIDDEEDEEIITTSSKKKIGEGIKLQGKKSLKEVADKMLNRADLDEMFRENVLMKELSFSMGNLFKYLEQRMPPIISVKAPGNEEIIKAVFNELKKIWDIKWLERKSLRNFSVILPAKKEVSSVMPYMARMAVMYWMFLVSTQENLGITEMLEKLLPGKRAPISEAGTWSAFKSLNESD